MNVLVCVKITPDAGDIAVRPDGSISLEKAEWIIGGFDLQAVEAGVRLAEATAGKVIALSAGPAAINQSKLRKDLLSRGPAELVLVADDGLRDADTAATAAVLAAAARRIGPVDVILTGEGSADLYFQQIGMQLAERLDVPGFNAVGKIEPAAEGWLRVERHLEDEFETLEVPLPAVLAVTTDIDPPRLPSMKEILKAGGKPVSEWSLADLGLEAVPAAKVAVLSTRAPRRAARRHAMIPGAAEEAARGLADALRREGLV